MTDINTILAEADLPKLKAIEEQIKLEKRKREIQAWLGDVAKQAPSSVEVFESIQKNLAQARGLMLPRSYPVGLDVEVRLKVDFRICEWDHKTQYPSQPSPVVERHLSFNATKDHVLSKLPPDVPVNHKKLLEILLAIQKQIMLFSNMNPNIPLWKIVDYLDPERILDIAI